MSSLHVIEIPAATLATRREYAAVRHPAGAPAGADASVREEKPLSPAERQALLELLQCWRYQLILAGDEVRRITARLGRA
jgi:hypothetical protein